MKRVAVLMTCYNRVQTTLACLRSLYAQVLPEGFSFDVWLVDDASPDRTGDLVKEAFPKVNVVRSKGNLFWCKGMRLAWDKAAEHQAYDYYLWLNDDVVLNAGALASLLNDAESLLARDPAVVIGTCSSDSLGERLSYGCYGENHVMVPNGNPQLATACQFSGNIVLVPKAVADCVGKIAGDYIHGCGDSDYCMRLRKARIPYYCSSVVSGVCPKQPERYIKFQGLSLRKRIESLFSPLGLAMHDAVLYRYRYWGARRAFLTACHLVWLALFPSNIRKVEK